MNKIVDYFLEDFDFFTFSPLLHKNTTRSSQIKSNKIRSDLVEDHAKSGLVRLPLRSSQIRSQFRSKVKSG